MNSTPTIGFTNKYYTLWHVSGPKIDVHNGYTRTRIDYNYMQNLSFDFEKAKAKMNEKVGEGSYDIDLELRARKSFHRVISSKWTGSDIFAFGKYGGKNFSEVNDDSYKVWYWGSIRGGEHEDPILTEYLLKRGFIFEYDGKLVTAEELKDQVANYFETNVYKDGFFATNGDTLALTLRLRKVGGFSTRFGYMNVFKFVDDATGEQFYYKGSSNLDIEENDVVELTGKVKHTRYYSDYHQKEVVQTELKRAKILRKY